MRAVLLFTPMAAESKRHRPVYFALITGY